MCQKNKWIRKLSKAHKAKVTMTFLKEQNIQVLAHFPYSPDLAPCDFWFSHHLSSHVSLNRQGRWGTRWFRSQFPPFFPVPHCPLGLGVLHACQFPDVVFPPLPLSAVSSSPFLCALQDGFGQTWSTGDMTILLQFASLYNCQKVFVWPDCLLDLGTDFLVGNMVFVWDAQYLAVALHFSCIFELREILLSFPTGFNLVNAAVVCAILESISGLEPLSVKNWA